MDDFSLIKLILLVLIGIVSGFINILAGGGSFLTVPVLIFMGLPPTVANATNRLSIFMQSMSAVKSFHGYGVLDLKFTLIVSIPAIAGGIFGTYLAMIVSDAAFKKYLALFMVLMTLATFLKPDKMLQKREVKYTYGRWILIWLTFFLIGMYGGFIQAGVGFLVLAGMLLTGYDFVAGNATKTFTIMLFTVVSLGMFIAKGMVVYVPGLALGVGSIIGAILGTRVTVTKGNVFIQRFVTVAVIFFAVLLFFK
jgi:uncharacterized membrane protein YfcA